MTIMELGAPGELLGAIGVIITLAYLTVQIKQNAHSISEIESILHEEKAVAAKAATRKV
jgi:hypothetical protein